MVIIHKAYNPDEVDGKVRHGFTIQLCWGDEKRKIRRFEWDTRYGIVNRDCTTTSLRPKGRALCVTVASPTQSNCQTSATSKGPSGTIPWDAMVYWYNGGNDYITSTTTKLFFFARQEVEKHGWRVITIFMKYDFWMFPRLIKVLAIPIHNLITSASFL